MTLFLYFYLIFTLAPFSFRHCKMSAFRRYFRVGSPSFSHNQTLARFPNLKPTQGWPNFLLVHYQSPYVSFLSFFGLNLSVSSDSPSIFIRKLRDYRQKSYFFIYFFCLFSTTFQLKIYFNGYTEHHKKVWGHRRNYDV